MRNINQDKSRCADSKIYVSENVLLRIIGGAVKETEGVSFPARRSTGVFSLFPPRKREKLSFEFSGGVMTVSAAVYILPGYSATETAVKIQKNVKSAVQSMIGTPVVSVNVAIIDICGR